MSQDTEVVPKRRGRPPKKKEKRPVGRPKGEAGILKEYKERMLNSPKSRKVLDAILNAALDDEHKHQAVAWKIVADRILPISSFTEAKNNGASVNITITGMSQDGVVIEGDSYDSEDTEDAEIIEDDVYERRSEETD